MSYNGDDEFNDNSDDGFNDNGGDGFDEALIGVGLGLMLDSLDKNRTETVVEEELSQPQETPEERKQRRYAYKKKLMKGFVKGFFISLPFTLLIAFGWEFMFSDEDDGKLFFHPIEGVIGSAVITLICVKLAALFKPNDHFPSQLWALHIVNAFFYPPMKLVILAMMEI